MANHMTYEECCAYAQRVGESGWIFNTNTQRGFSYIVSGYEHYCSIGWMPVCRVDAIVKFTPMFTGVSMKEK